MKKILVVVAGFTLVLALGIAEQFWITGTFRQLETRTEELLAEADAGTLSEEKMTETNDWWTGRKRVLHIYIPHNEIRDVDYWLSEADGYVKQKEYRLAYAQLAILLDAAKTIPNSFRFKLENIM